MSLNNGRRIVFRKVPIDKIVIDKYQRPLEVKRVDGMVGGYDSHLNQPPEVSLREDGRYACFEGQHRVAMERKRGASHVLCRVHEGLTKQEEAHYFAAFQLERRGLRPYHRFRAQLYAGEPLQVEIDKVVEAYGFKVSNSGGGSRNIAAVTALEQIYQKGGAPHLGDVLGLLRDTWDGDEGLTQHPMLLGVSTFLIAFGDKVGDRARGHLRRVAPIIVMRRAMEHGAPRTATAQGVAYTLRKAAKMTNAQPVRYTSAFGPPPAKPKPKKTVRRKVTTV